MNAWEALFVDEDDEAFRLIVGKLLSLSASDRRRVSPDEYVSMAREKWHTCKKDSVYAVKLLFDPLVQPQFQTESETELFCVLVARVGQQGQLIDAPEGYEPPNYPDVRLSHIVAGSPSGGEESDPSRPTDYLIAFLDVLGFEALLLRVGLEEVNERYGQLLEQALRPESEERPWAKAASIVQNEIVPALMWLPIHTAYFSDSLVLWVQFHPGHVQEFLYRCSRVFCKALELGIPLRGAITVGPAIFHKERSVYLGFPLIEAARLESKLDWARSRTWGFLQVKQAPSSYSSGNLQFFHTCRHLRMAV